MRTPTLVLAGLCALVAAATAQTAPYTENFDSLTVGTSTPCSTTAATGGWTLPAGWTETAGVNGWRPWSGGTPSGTTGPSSTISGTGNYMYCESSATCGNPTVLFELTTPAVDISALTAPALDVSYHAYGAAIGTFEVQQSDGLGGWITLLSFTGDQGNTWQTVQLPMTVVPNPQVRFRYTSGTTFTGDIAIDDVGFVNQSQGATWQPNDPRSTIDLDGNAAATICPGQTSNFNAASSLVGNVHDIAISVLPRVAGGTPQSAVTANFQTVNVDLWDPMLYFAYQAVTPGGVPIPFPSGGYTVPISSVSSAQVSGQQWVADVNAPDGFVLSQAVELTSGAMAGSVPLSLPDDGNMQVLLAPPLCTASLAFYGTTYSDIYVNSNGDVSFTTGHTDFTPTYLEWTSNMPRVGFQSDLQPNVYGTVDVVNVPAGIAVNYTNVTEWGTSGMGVTSYSIDLSGGSASILGFTTDGTWGTSPTIMGISNGSAGTHPPAVSFDGLFTAGGSGSALATDSWIDENLGGMVPGAGPNFGNITWPVSDGSTVLLY